jgi:hypothetical protein
VAPPVKTARKDRAASVASKDFKDFKASPACLGLRARKVCPARMA